MVRNSLLPNGMRVKENFSNSTRSASATANSITNLSTNALDINTGAVVGVEGINVGEPHVEELVSPIIGLLILIL